MTNAPVLDGAQPPTLTEWADQRRRQAILGGDFGPGDPPVISRLAQQLGLSATPLREAFRNLAFHPELLSTRDSDWLPRMATLVADGAGLMISERDADATG